MPRNLIFFSYSHQDIKWLNELKKMLSPWVHANQLSISLWDDTKITPGTLWRQEIDTALNSASVAVLLVSDNFLASEFIRENELPPLLEASRKEGLSLLWVYVSACLYKYTEIADYQSAQTKIFPLDLLNKPRRKLVLAEICEQIIESYEKSL